MKLVEPKILSGFMELLPKDQILFNKMMDTIKETYESFGFLPLDTPIIEYSSVLLAKAGGETEKQVYQFKKGDNDLSLRFDLTVPLARYVAMNKNNLAFPFKRYQIGKVYRGERPQKGRYREFYQCDIDIIGNDSLGVEYDAEIPAIIYNIFKKLNIGDFLIRINNRKLLNGFFNSLNINYDNSYILRIIDKYDKIGRDEIIKLFKDMNLDNEVINKIMSFIEIKGSSNEIINKLKELNIDNEDYINGLNELEKISNLVKVYGISEDNFNIDLTITRGLDYYTGTVYETFIKDNYSLGSVCSGGRYDNLAEFYTADHLPGVGISIGLTRLFSELKERQLIKPDNKSTAKVIVIPMSENEFKFSIKVSNEIRNNNINTVLCNNSTSFKSNMKYANKLGIPYVIIIGSDEMNNDKVMLKNMTNGSQELLSISEVLERIK